MTPYNETMNSSPVLGVPEFLLENDKGAWGLVLLLGLCGTNSEAGDENRLVSS